MDNKEKMIRWLLDAIDTEIAKPDEEADMALVEECTALLGELNGDVCTLSKRELEKRCRAITGEDVSVTRKGPKIRVRVVAALAACMAVFMVMSSCGYLPPINVILQTLFASDVGKDVEVHEVKYTFKGMIKRYDNLSSLISTEDLDILLPNDLPNNIFITNILKDDNSGKIIITFNDINISFQVFTNTSISKLIPTDTYTEYINNDNIIYLKELTNTAFIAYTEINNNVYYVHHTDLEFVRNILTNLR